jgi:hypothetical protein
LRRNPGTSSSGSRTLTPGARRLGRTLNMGRSLKNTSGQSTRDVSSCQ